MVFLIFLKSGFHFSNSGFISMVFAGIYRNHRVSECAVTRALDDKAFALDHFQTKLLRLPDTMQTARGRKLARHNADFLIQFMAKLSAELQGDYLGTDSQILTHFRRSVRS